MARVIGIGGIFFRSSDPKPLFAWYETHLGIPRNAYGCAEFDWRHADDPDRTAKTVWSLFPRDTTYFGPTNPSFMINYIVDDLDGMLEALRTAGAKVDPEREDHEYGRFAWVTDPEGNRIELWEPPRSPSATASP